MPEDRLRREIIERLMCDLAVDLDNVARAHGRAGDDLATELARLDEIAKDGVVIRNGHRVAIPDAARPFLRNVCAVFDRYLTTEAQRHSRSV
jgi:oxygen-independent coproporphyrinogen-3 oxidase